VAAKEFPLSVVIRAIDRVTAPLRAVQGRVLAFDRKLRGSFARMSDKLGLPAMRAAVGRVGNALGDLAARAAKVGAMIGGAVAAAAGLAGLAMRSLIGTAAQFERYETILGTIEGSQEGARKAMDWVSDFAAKTPYELDEVMEAFVKLKAYGIDPTNGTLTVLGDTAAAMGKPVMQAVEAIADALTGENERLKEFGIRARKDGDKIVYEYTKDGQTMRKAAQASNRAMIQATLLAIWNDRYAGAMDKLSGTWEGMVSNLSDQWTRFKRMIMESGPFEELRKRLSALLQRIDAMAESGELEALAESIGGWMVEQFNKLWDAGKRLADNWDEVRGKIQPLVDAVDWLCDTFGTANVIIFGVAAALTVALVPSLYATATAFYALGTAIMTTPVGWVLAAIAAIAGAVMLIYRNWEPITDFFSTWWDTVKNVFSVVADFIGGIWDELLAGFEGGFIKGIINAWNLLNPLNLITRAFRDLVPNILKALAPWAQKLKDTFGSWVPDWAQKLLGWDAVASYGNGGKAGASAIGSSVASQQGAVRVEVDLNNLPPGARVRTEERGRPNFELNQGYSYGVLAP